MSITFGIFLLTGGYAMPERYAIELAAPHTLRGDYKARVPAGWIFADEDPVGYQRSIQLLAEIGIDVPRASPSRARPSSGKVVS